MRTLEEKKTMFQCWKMLNIPNNRILKDLKQKQLTLTPKRNRNTE